MTSLDVQKQTADICLHKVSIQMILLSKPTVEQCETVKPVFEVSVCCNADVVLG